MIKVRSVVEKGERGRERERKRWRDRERLCIRAKDT
jgi:hypothetical protein